MKTVYMATLQACSLDVRPTAGAPRVLVKLGRGRRGKIALPTSEQLHPDRTIALHMGKEWAVVQQAIAGNSDAQEHLFTRQTSRLYRTAFALLCNKEDAEDAVQESLCKAYTRLRSFEGRSSFSTWLTRIVINSALMARRRRKSVHPETSLDEILSSQPERLPHGLIDARPDPEKLCAETEIAALIEEQIRQLPPLLQTTFRLRATNGLSSNESSEVLGIRASAFKSRISRARRKLAHGLQQTWRFASPCERAAQQAPADEEITTLVGSRKLERSVRSNHSRESE